MNLLQYYYLKHNNLDAGFNKKNKYFLISDMNKNIKNNDLFIANWSLSETPIRFRNKFIKTYHLANIFLLVFGKI